MIDMDVSYSVWMFIDCQELSMETGMMSFFSFLHQGPKEQKARDLLLFGINEVTRALEKGDVELFIMCRYFLGKACIIV